MRVREEFELPEDKAEALRKARALEWLTIFFLLTITALMYYTMGSSQAMKTAWIEDVLSLIPPIGFLIASHKREGGASERYPYGRERIMTISFTAAAMALLILGLYMLYDSAMGLLTFHHPTIGHREILGVRTWSGWFMIGALVYSVIPVVILGRLKQPVARELHEKTLMADADMNKADWMTGVAAIVGVLGVGLGLWWADSVAALVIALDVTKDGVTNLKGVFSDIMDQRPTTVDRKPAEELIGKAVDALKDLEWVEDADIRLREEGMPITGEAFVVPAGRSATTAQLREAVEAVHDVDWKMHDIVVTIVDEVGERRDPRAEDGTLKR